MKADEHSTSAEPVVHAPAPRSWTVRSAADTLHVHLSLWGMIPLSTLRVVLPPVICINFVVYLVVFFVHPAPGPRMSQGRILVGAVLNALYWGAYMLVFIDLLRADGLVRLPRSLHVGPLRWHASTGMLWWRRRAEGNTADLTLKVIKDPSPEEGVDGVEGALLRLMASILMLGKRRCRHTLYLQLAGAPGQFLKLWQVPYIQADFAEVTWLADSVRRHMRRMGTTAAVETQPEPRSVLGLLRSSQPPSWNLHIGRKDLRLELPMVWAQFYDTSAIVELSVACLVGLAVCIALLYADRWITASQTVITGVQAGCWAGLSVGVCCTAAAAFTALSSSCPRVLELGPESYRIMIGWRRLCFVRRTGKCANLRVTVLGGCDGVSVNSLQLTEVGVPGKVKFWAPELLPLKGTAWTSTSSPQVLLVAAIILAHVDSLAEGSKIPVAA